MDTKGHLYTAEETNTCTVRHNYCKILLIFSRFLKDKKVEDYCIAPILMPDIIMTVANTETSLNKASI